MNPATDDPVLHTIRRSILHVLPGVDPGLVVPQRSLSELGCNSIDRADVVTLAMEELGVAVPVTDFAGVQDIGGLAAVLRRHLG